MEQLEVVNEEDVVGHPGVEQAPADPGEDAWERGEQVIEAARLFAGSAGQPFVFMFVYDNAPLAGQSNMFVGHSLPLGHSDALVALTQNALERALSLEAEAGNAQPQAGGPGEPVDPEAQVDAAED